MMMEAPGAPNGDDEARAIQEHVLGTTAFSKMEGPHGAQVAVPDFMRAYASFEDYLDQHYKNAYVEDPGRARTPLGQIANLTLDYHTALRAAPRDEARLDALRARVRAWEYTYARNRWSSADHQAGNVPDALVVSLGVGPRAIHFMAVVGVAYNPEKDPQGYDGDVALLLRPLMYARNARTAPRLLETSPEQAARKDPGSDARIVYGEGVFRSEDPRATGEGPRRVVRATLLNPWISPLRLWTRLAPAPFDDFPLAKSRATTRFDSYGALLEHYHGLLTAGDATVPMNMATDFGTEDHLEAAGQGTVAVYGTSVQVDPSGPREVGAGGRALAYPGHVSYIYAASLPLGYERVRGLAKQIPALSDELRNPGRYLGAMLPLSAPTPQGDPNLPAVYFDMLFEYATPSDIEGVTPAQLQQRGNGMYQRVIKATRQRNAAQLARLVRAMAYAWTHTDAGRALDLAGLNAAVEVVLEPAERLTRAVPPLYATYLRDVLGDRVPALRFEAPEAAPIAPAATARPATADVPQVPGEAEPVEPPPAEPAPVPFELVPQDLPPLEPAAPAPVAPAPKPAPVAPEPAPAGGAPGGLATLDGLIRWQNRMENPRADEGRDIGEGRRGALPQWSRILYKLAAGQIRTLPGPMGTTLRVDFAPPDLEGRPVRREYLDAEPVTLEIRDAQQILADLGDEIAEVPAGARALTMGEEVYGWVSGTNYRGKPLGALGGTLVRRAPGVRGPVPAAAEAIPRAGLIRATFESPEGGRRVYGSTAGATLLYYTLGSPGDPEFHGPITRTNLDTGDQEIVGSLGGFDSGGERTLRYLFLIRSALGEPRA